jgi:hypothetical protein
VNIGTSKGGQVNKAKLGKQAAELVRLDGPRLDEALPGPLYGQYSLLIDILDGYEAHGRSAYRFTDSLCISRIIFVLLDIGFNVLRRHQAHAVALCLELASPVMGAAAGVHPDKAGWQVDKESDNLVAFELLLGHGLAMRIDSVDLEDILREVDASVGDLHGGRPFRFKWLINAAPVALRCRLGGASIPLIWSCSRKRDSMAWCNCSHTPAVFQSRRRLQQVMSLP